MTAERHTLFLHRRFFSIIYFVHHVLSFYIFILQGFRPTLGDSSFSPHAVLGDCPDHSPTTAQGLFSSATCDLDSHTVERHLFSLTLLQGSYFTLQQARGTFQHHTLLHLTLRPRVKPGPYKPFRMTCRLNRYN